MRLFYQPEGKLRLEMNEQCWLDVRPSWAAPLSHPGKYLSLLDGKEKEIVMFNDPSVLEEGNFAILKDELNRRYLTSRVHRVLSVSTEFGVTYWHVVTDRGEKEFVTVSLQENAQWMGPRQLLLIDVDGNRYEIVNIDELDKNSQELLSTAV